MIVYINQNGEIHDVGTTTDETLIPVEIIDDEENPFHGWSDARICCYRVQVVEGRVVMMTPYVSSILIDFVDRFGTDIVEAEQEITEQDLSMMEAEQGITDLDLRLMEIENAQEGGNDEA